MKQLSILFILFNFVGCTNGQKSQDTMEYTNTYEEDKMLLVLAAPSIHEKYYKPAFQQIVDFQIAYANSVMGNDNILILVDEDTRPYYEDLPEDILITAAIEDIWMRDFTTINPLSPVQLIYTDASTNTIKESEQIQTSFNVFAEDYDLDFETSDLIIDGGNIVDNYEGKIITTTRFLEDNDLTYEEGQAVLMETFGAAEVAIIEPDEDALAHADGMVMWLNKETLLVNDYSEDMEFRNLVLEELKAAFPTTTIIEMPVEHKENKKGEWAGFSSACGVNLNAVLTFNTVYVPIFNMEHDEAALEIIRKNTDKKVVPIQAENVCGMGGSVRCLTWQVTGENAEKLIKAARE